MEREFKGLWIPKEIWFDEKLTWSEKLLFVEIDSFNKKGACFAGNQYFADFFNLSKDRVSKLVSSLKNKGYIDISFTYKPNSKQIEKRIIKVNPKYRLKQLEGVVESAFGYSYEQLEGIVKNYQDINTSNINTDNNINNNTSIVAKATFPKKFIELYNLYDGKKNDIEIEYDKWIEKCEWEVDYDILLKRLKSGNKQPFQSWLNKFRTEPSKFPKIIIEEYQVFHEKQTGLKKDNFKNYEILAIESISQQIEKAVIDKLGNTNDLENNIRSSIKLIFDNWGSLEKFYQNQITPQQIEKNFSLILKQIKDAKGKSNNKIGRLSVEDFNNIGSTIDFEKYNNY